LEHFLCFNTSAGNGTNGAEFKHKQPEKEGERAGEGVLERERERRHGVGGEERAVRVRGKEGDFLLAAANHFRDWE